MKAGTRKLINGIKGFHAATKQQVFNGGTYTRKQGLKTMKDLRRNHGGDSSSM